MKKKGILLIISLLALFFINELKNKKEIIKSNNSTRLPEATSDHLLSIDQKKLEAQLDQKSIRLAIWKDVSDFSRRPNELLSKQNANEFFKMASLNIPRLNDCLKKNYCGMERRNDEDPYFNSHKTPGHIYLGRFLELLKESIKINPQLVSQIDWDLITDLTQNSNDQVRLLALDLLSENHDTKNNFDSLVSIANNFKGEAKADAFLKLSARLNNENKALFVDSLEKSFAEDDNNTILSIVANLQKLSLSKTEIEHVSKNLCHLKENELNEGNWKMVKYDLSKLNVDIDQICN